MSVNKWKSYFSERKFRNYISRIFYFHQHTYRKYLHYSITLSSIELPNVNRKLTHSQRKFKRISIKVSFVFQKRTFILHMNIVIYRVLHWSYLNFLHLDTTFIVSEMTNATTEKLVVDAANHGSMQNGCRSEKG